MNVETYIGVELSVCVCVCVCASLRAHVCVHVGVLIVMVVKLLTCTPPKTVRLRLPFRKRRHRCHWKLRWTAPRTSHHVLNQAPRREPQHMQKHVPYFSQTLRHSTDFEVQVHHLSSLGAWNNVTPTYLLCLYNYLSIYLSISARW
jgi:hypothetical protein